MHPHLFRDLVVRDTDRVVPYTIGLQEHADYFVPHRHHFIEFTYVIRGEGTETVDGRVHPLRPGTFSLLLPSQVHMLHADADDPVSLYVGGIDPGSLPEPAPLMDDLARLLLHAPENLPAHVRFLGEEAEKMETLFREMLLHHSGQGAWDPLLFFARLFEALALFDQKRRTAPARAAHPAAPLERSDFRHIVHYIQTHVNEPLTLHTLAERFHRSESSISAGFRRLMGGSYHDFIHDMRIRDACALLRSSSLSVTEVAVEVGFESYETFARVFRQRKGVTATAWRKKTTIHTPS